MKMIRLLTALAMIPVALTFNGCIEAIMFAPEAIGAAGSALRGAAKDIQVTELPNHHLTDIRNKVLGVTVTGQWASHVGATDTGVYPDMLATELERNGFRARAVNQPADITDNRVLKTLSDKGIQVILSCRATQEIGSSGTLGAISGGHVTKTGVLEFVVTGTDTATGDNLFRATGKYGKPRSPSEWAKDLAKAIKDKVQK